MGSVQQVSPLDNSIKLRYFFKAIDPAVAYEVEKDGVPDDWKKAVAEATKVDRVLRDGVE